MFEFALIPAMMPPVDCTASAGTPKLETVLSAPEPVFVFVVKVASTVPADIESFRICELVPT